MRIGNRSAFHNYEIVDKFETGVILTGGEVKSLYLGQASLEEAYVKLIDGEAFLINAHIHPYQFADNRGVDSRRTRKLLLHHKELLNLDNKLKQGSLTLVPIAWYNKGPKIKLEIGLARGKKTWEKKEQVKRRDLDREVEAQLRAKR